MSEISDEVCAINSIYENCMTEWAPSIYDISIPETTTVLRLSFPAAYPEKMPSLMAVIKGNQLLQHTFDNLIDSVFTPGQVIVFDYLEACRELIEKEKEHEAKEDEEKERREQHSNLSDDYRNGSKIESEDIFAGWITGEPIVDRKSIFIARVCEVHSAQEVDDKISLLKLDKRIARAAHNMTAYRIKRPDGVVIQDCDDDGEDAAGGRLMHLLTLTDSWNVLVFVSRWYGGIKLGPDRFKHINSSARDALVLGGFIKGKTNKHN